MIEVIGVRFKNTGKVYSFDPQGMEIKPGYHVVVETAKGLEYAECVAGNHMVDDSAVRPPLRPVIRISTPEDDEKAAENREKEKEAFKICSEKIRKYNLDMKLVDVEYNFEGNKILFFFTSDGRVDFRELVKELASVFRTRIELRQIGVRDEARMIGGLGICGKPFCCAQFLDDFAPVSIKMAKTQGLSLNPTKISGTCGRLMCCLKYEQDAYEELVQNVPKMDSFVDTPAGKGSVVDVNILKGKVRVRLETPSEAAIKTFNADEITVIGGKAKRAEYLAALAAGREEEPESQPKVKKTPATRAVKPAAAEEHKDDAPETEALPNAEGESRPRQNSGRNNQRRRNPRQRPAKSTAQSGQEVFKETAKQADAGESREPKDQGSKKSSSRHRYYRNRRPGGKKGGAKGDKQNTGE